MHSARDRAAAAVDEPNVPTRKLRSEDPGNEGRRSNARAITTASFFEEHSLDTTAIVDMKPAQNIALIFAQRS
jgi:hypothetical protein